MVSVYNKRYLLTAIHFSKRAWDGSMGQRDMEEMNILEMVTDYFKTVQLFSMDQIRDKETVNYYLEKKI